MWKNRVSRSKLVILVLCGLMLTNSGMSTNGQIPTPDIGGSIAWSPDGLELAVAENSGIFIYDRNGTLMRYVIEPNIFYSAFSGWSLDGRSLLLGNHIRNADTLESTLSLTGYARGWAVDNQLFGLQSNNLVLWNADSGQQTLTIPLPFQVEEAIASPNGRWIGIGGGFFVDLLNAGRLSQINYTGYYTWSPDSNLIASVVPNQQNPEQAQIEIVDLLSGVVLRRSAPFAAIIQNLVWAQNAPVLAGLDYSGGIFMWDTNTLNLLNNMNITVPTTNAFDISPFGGVVAVGSSIGLEQQTTPSASRGSESNSNRLLANGAIVLATPKSILSLQAIASACNAPAAATRLLTARMSESRVQAFASAIEALPDSALPPACEADLLAVASALAAG
jgi:WD40 repeat protein